MGGLGRLIRVGSKAVSNVVDMAFTGFSIGLALTMLLLFRLDVEVKSVVKRGLENPYETAYTILASTPFKDDPRSAAYFVGRCICSGKCDLDLNRYTKELGYDICWEIYSESGLIGGSCTGYGSSVKIPAPCGYLMMWYR